MSRNLKLAGHSMRQQHQQRVRKAVFSPGDRVSLHNPHKKRGLSPKLTSQWEGPHTVTEVLSAVTYRLTRPRAGRKSKVVHVDRLWRYAGDATFSWEGQDGTVQTPSPGSESGDDPALDSNSQGEERSDSGDSSDSSDGEAERQVFETNRPTRGGRPPQWLREYVEI